MNYLFINSFSEEMKSMLYEIEEMTLDVSNDYFHEVCHVWFKLFYINNVYNNHVVITNSLVENSWRWNSSFNSWKRKITLVRCILFDDELRDSR